MDVLVNNVGVGYFSSIEEAAVEETRKMFEINFWGLMHMTNAVLPYMRRERIFRSKVTSNMLNPLALLPFEANKQNSVDYF